MYMVVSFAAILLSPVLLAVAQRQDMGTRSARRPLSANGECTTEEQRLALMLFYNATNGQTWFNSEGWPTIPGLHNMTQAQAMAQLAIIPMQSNNCNSSVGAWGVMRDTGSSSSGNVTVLPDHCCWYGVACCGPDTCGNDPYCSCTKGMVTSLQLSNNRVRGGTDVIMPANPLFIFLLQ